MQEKIIRGNKTYNYAGSETFSMDDGVTFWKRHRYQLEGGSETNELLFYNSPKQLAQGIDEPYIPELQSNPEPQQTKRKTPVRKLKLECTQEEAKPQHITDHRLERRKLRNSIRSGIKGYKGPEY